MASVNIPPQVPFIGGDSLANINFALDYLPNEPSDQSFVAVWTNVNLFITSFTIGFKIDFAGDFNLIDGNDVQQIETTINTVQTVSDYTYTGIRSPSAAPNVTANVTIGSPSFEGYDYADTTLPVSDTVSDTAGDHIYYLSQPDPILPSMTITVYQDQENGGVQELGTVTFDPYGKHGPYTPIPGFEAYKVTNVSEAGGLVQLTFAVDPGPTTINASYQPANGGFTGNSCKKPAPMCTRR